MPNKNMNKDKQVYMSFHESIYLKNNLKIPYAYSAPSPHCH